MLMRKKLVQLILALAALAAATLSSVPPAEAARCNGFLVCCSPEGPCYCCIKPCPIQCP
jgi:hypothetical protein